LRSKRTSDNEFTEAWTTRRDSKASVGNGSMAARSTSSRSALLSGLPRTRRSRSARQQAARYSFSSTKLVKLGTGTNRFRRE